MQNAESLKASLEYEKSLLEFAIRHKKKRSNIQARIRLLEARLAAISFRETAAAADGWPAGQRVGFENPFVGELDKAKSERVMHVLGNKDGVLDVAYKTHHQIRHDIHHKPSLWVRFLRAIGWY